MRQPIHPSSACYLCFWGKWEFASPHCLPAHQRAAASQHSSGSGSHNSAFGVCNCVTSSIASKWTQPALSTLTGGPAKKGFVTLSQRVVLMLCSTVRSHSFSFALCLQLLHWVHTLRGSVSQMHADKLAHESEEIRFVQRAHIYTHTHALNFTLCKLSTATLCVIPVVILISSEEPCQGNNELKSWGRGHAEWLCVVVCVCACMHMCVCVQPSKWEER